MPETTSTSYRLELSSDGTQKLTNTLPDGLQIETCILYLPDRDVSRIFCISSQAGCPFRCQFCGSGHRPFFRNLTAREIVEQIHLAKHVTKDSCHTLFNVSYMGVGEPLSNFCEVSKSIAGLFNTYDHLRRVNVSTVGPRKGIDALAMLPYKGRLHLQLSLHSPFDEERYRLF